MKNGLVVKYLGWYPGLRVFITAPKVRTTGRKFGKTEEEDDDYWALNWYFVGGNSLKNF